VSFVIGSFRTRAHRTGVVGLVFAALKDRYETSRSSRGGTETSGLVVDSPSSRERLQAVAVLLRSRDLTARASFELIELFDLNR
jgi:hypothetical protein